MSKMRGLPQTKRMRHDFHFVEQLLSNQSIPVGQALDILLLDPAPGQPRKDFGDLSDMISSIKDRGVLEPILVRKTGTRFQIIAGERRYKAAMEAGLARVPCIELDVDEQGMLEISLIENLQRRDLNPFEEADAIHQLVETLDLTHNEAARRLGRSRTSLTETLSLVHVPAAIRERCLGSGILGRSILLQIARLKREEQMIELLDKIEKGKLTRQDVRDLRKAKPTANPGRPKGYTFKFQPPDRSFRLQLRFGRSKVAKRELVEALRAIISSIETS